MMKTLFGIILLSFFFLSPCIGLSSSEQSRTYYNLSDVLYHGSTADPEFRVLNTIEKPPFITSSNGYAVFSLRLEGVEEGEKLKLRDNLADEIHYYQSIGNRLVKQSYYNRFSNKTNSIELHQCDSCLVHFFVKSPALINLLVLRAEKQMFEKTEYFEQFIKGIFVAVIVFGILICVTLLFTTRKRQYFRYAVYLFSVLLAQSLLLGLNKALDTYLPQAVAQRQYSVFLPLSFLGSYYFLNGFFKLQSRFKIINYAFYLLLISVVLHMCFWDVLPKNLRSIGIEMNSFFGAILTTILTFVALSKKIKLAKYFALAWSFFLAGIIIYFLSLSGLIPSSLFTTHMMTIGTCFESVIILTFVVIEHEKQNEKISSLEIRVNALQSAIDELKKTIDALKSKLLSLKLFKNHFLSKAHFISNCLNGIAALIAMSDLIGARHYLTKFGRLMRGLLRNDKNDEILLYEESILLQAYCNMEVFRLQKEVELRAFFGEGVSIHTMQVPNLVIQPIVENAFLHGLKGLQERKPKLELRFKIEGDLMLVEVEDNGHGRNLDKINNLKVEKEQLLSLDEHVSVGTHLIKERIRLLLGKPDFEPLQYIDLKDENGQPCGTIAKLYMPWTPYEFKHPKNGHNPFEDGFYVEVEGESLSNI